MNAASSQFPTLELAQLIDRWNTCAREYQHRLQQHAQSLHGLLDQLVGRSGLVEALQQRCGQLEQLLKRCQQEMVQQAARLVESEEQLQAIAQCLQKAGFEDPSPLAALGRLIARYEQAQQQARQAGQTDAQALKRLEKELKALREQNQQLLRQLGEAEQALEQQRSREEEQQRLWLQELQALRQLVQQQALGAASPQQGGVSAGAGALQDLRAAVPDGAAARGVASRLRRLRKNRETKNASDKRQPRP